MTEAWKRRIFALIALTVAGTALGAISFSNMGEDLVYYWSPEELLARADAQDHTVRLGGQVQPGTVEWDKEKQTVAFVVLGPDGKTAVPVVSKGNPPQMFRENIGVVVEGKLAADGVFYSDTIMVKHSNEYQAPGEEGADPTKKYETLAEGNAAG